MKVDIRSNLKEVARGLPKLRSDLLDKATVKALNRAATSVRSEASKEIRKEYNIKATVAKGQITIIRATALKLTATVKASGKRIPLSEFGARWNRNMPGTSVKVKTKGPRKIVKHAWMMPTPSGKMGVFRRVGKNRYPVEFLLSVGIAQAFASKAVSEKLVEIAQDRFEVVLGQEIKFQLRKK